MIARKHLPLLAVVLILAGVQIYRAERPQKLDPFSPNLLESTHGDQVPFSVQCARPLHGSFRFHSHAFTTVEEARKHDVIAHPEHLASDQVKYFRGLFHFSEINGLRMNALASSDIHVRKVRKIRYPYHLRLDPANIDSARKPTSATVPEVAMGVPGIEVEYDARLSSIVCQRTDEPKFPLRTVLPLDPYLAYWYVPKANRRLVSWSKIQAETNPCSYEQMADLKYPDLYWYVWNPTKKGQGFDCSALLNRDKLVKISADFSLDPILTREYSIQQKLGSGPIRVGIIFGYLLPKEVESTVRELKKNASRFGADPNWPRGDPGIQIANAVLNMFGKFTELGTWKVRETEGNYVFTNKGRLKQSRREIEIEAFVGPTVEYQAGRKHWKFLEQALQNDSFIFYQGHAGMGTTFTLQELARQTGHELKLDALPAYQFVGVLSCFATDYYGDDIRKLRSRPGMTTDLLLSGYEGFSFMMIPAVLQYVDLSLAGHQVSLKKSMERFQDIDEPVHFDRYTD